MDWADTRITVPVGESNHCLYLAIDQKLACDTWPRRRLKTG